MDMEQTVYSLAALIKNQYPISARESLIKWLETVSENIGLEHEHKEHYVTLRNSDDIGQALIALSQISGLPIHLLRK